MGGNGDNAGTSATSLVLLDGFELRVGGRFVPVPANVQRLLAFLAVRRRPQHRTTVAGMLWLDSPDEDASRNLRTTLWRARKVAADAVEATGAYLRMAASVHIDLREALGAAERLLRGDEDAGAPTMDEVDALGGDLLPEWSDEWVLIERERLRQLRMHALEQSCTQLAAAGRFAHAVEAGLAAVAVEPLRESAHRVLIETYLAEGNRCEAIRHFEGFRALLQDNLGVDPSEGLRRLVAVPLARA